MKNDKIFARSFTRHDLKRFGYTALVGCFVVTWYSLTVFKPYFGMTNLLNLRLKTNDSVKLEMLANQTRPYFETKETKLICNTSKRSTDTCEMKGDIRIQGNSSTIFVFTPHVRNRSWSIKPYARKEDPPALESITSFTIKSVQELGQTMPECVQTHNVPAIVFSVGGYVGNNFHAFSDVIIPLFATSKRFNREVQFLLTNKNTRWITKNQELLHGLSRFEIIDIDHEKDVHCFSSMIVGLTKEDNKELYTVGFNPNNHFMWDPMKDFTKFLRHSYSLERLTALKLTKRLTKRPRLLIVSRQKTRAFTSVEEVVLEAENMGFKVIVSEMNGNLTQVSKMVNSCDVMMGVHGAGLTNMVFLPENGVLIQVVPWGKMDWLANTCYGKPTKEMGLKYLEYKISEGESTLIEQYPLNHSVFRDPVSSERKSWQAFKSTYMDKQDVKLELTRFRETLSTALELLS